MPRRRWWWRRTILTAAALLALLACVFGAYRFLDRAFNLWAPDVDFRALDARVRAELPPGATGAEVVAWLRGNGFPDDRIRLIRYSADRSLYAIDAWIPQRSGYWKYTAIVVRCDFKGGRATECRAYPSGEPQPLPGTGSLEIVAPSPAP